MECCVSGFQVERFASLVQDALFCAEHAFRPTKGAAISPLRGVLRLILVW